jgi:hypothetical protein
VYIAVDHSDLSETCASISGTHGCASLASKEPASGKLSPLRTFTRARLGHLGHRTKRATYFAIATRCSFHDAR